MLALVVYCALFTAAQGLQPCRSSRWESAFLANVTNSLPDLTRADFCFDAGSNRFITTPSDTGTSHFVLAGSLGLHVFGKQNGAFSVLRVGDIAADEIEQTAVLLHIWLRALCTGSRTIVRGFGFLQAVHPLYQVQGQVQLEMLLRPLKANLFGLKADQDHQHTFDVLWRAETERARFTAPFSLETSFPHAQTANHYQLHVGGFLQHVIFTPKVFSCLPPVSRPSPAIITVLPHSHTLVEDPRHLELVTQLLIRHVRHHLKLGIAGTVHYEVEPFLSKLSSNPQIHLLIQQGSLLLIAWDSEVQGYMPNGLVWHKNSAKTLQYNHAVLAHWGLDVYLNPMDIDEFMASEQPRSIAQLLQSDCIVPGGQTLLYRYDVRCGSCTEGESQVWLSNRTNPLAKYNETDWKVRLRGKPILYADTSYSMAIHESGNWHGGAQHYKQCMFHIHLVNLFGFRRGADDDAQFGNDTSWDWLV